MTSKKNINLTKEEALSLAWKSRKDYKGYDKSKGSSFNSWRAIMYTEKGKKIGCPDNWNDYKVFISEVQGEWENGKIVRRFDTSKPHSKENSFWGEKGTENNCKLVSVEYKGESKTIIEWCAEFGLNYNGVRQRYFKGKNYSSEQILFGKNKRLHGKITDINDLSFQEKRDKISKLLSAYRLKDRQKGYENDIDIDFVREMIQQPCVYCEDTKRIGLDRIDNSKGHLKTNVVPCCYECNISRQNNFTHDEMKIIGQTIKIVKQCRLNKAT